MSRRTYFVISCLYLLAAASPTNAHHSFAAEFDINKPVKVHGVVTKMEWTNPHSWIYLDVAGPDGKVINWHFELGSPNALFRLGWKRDSVPAGLQVDVSGYQSKKGDAVANATGVKLPNGQSFLTGGSAPSVVK